jgi:leucyl aminopeptidase
VLDCYLDQAENLIPIIALTTEQWPSWLTQQPSVTTHWLTATQFCPKPGQIALLPNEHGHLAQVILILGDVDDFWSFGGLSTTLPPGHYHYDGISDALRDEATFAWGLGAYTFNRYKKKTTKSGPQLFLTDTVNKKVLQAKLEAIYLARDLINTPTEAMGPEELAEKIREVGKKHSATVTQIIGPDLLSANYLAIHAVGRASVRAPRLVDLRWGSPQYPKITLVGKGVCFDAGGLNLKSGSGMLLMKKDMGGAANALALADLIMAFNLPVCLRLLIPAVENLVAGNAYKPGDVIPMRNGLQVEVSDTDAEGRLILADALSEASTTQPDLLIDFSTLTGAARIALGTEISAFFTRQNSLATELLQHSEHAQDPLWRLPLYKPYQKLLDSKLADINNTGTSSYAGAITAALFLSQFVPESLNWVHIDFNAYNVMNRPGRPEGGEAMAILAIIRYLCEKYVA